MLHLCDRYSNSIFITELRKSDISASDDLKKSVAHFMKHALDTQALFLTDHEKANRCL